MQTNPLESEWERAAVKELTDMLSHLCHGSFTSPEDFCNRMDLSARSLRSLYDCSQLEQLKRWRQRLGEWTGGDM
jgi:hypothetical protein